jgi:poly-gamma-glutamate capsule biosynthesis protein CapA/YwtB (metallophosphatase superfamily)
MVVALAIPPAGAVAFALRPAPLAQPASPRADTSPVGIADPAPAPRRPPPVRRYTIAATGDILIHSSVWERAAAYGAENGERYDFRPMLRPLRPLIGAADLAICHLETPLSPDDADLSSYPSFNAPREVADAIALAGYDSCSTASNHTIDQGGQGVDDTLAVLDEAGIAHAGSARSEREGDRITMLQLGSVRVAHLSYTYGLNGIPLPDGEPWRANLIEPRRIARDAAEARREGADLVLASMHWGTEYVSEPNDHQRTVAQAVARSGAVDVVLGHHAHVVQPIERIRDTWVAFGMGNSLSGMTSPEKTDGLIVQVLIRQRGDRVRVTDVRYVPTWNEPDTYRVLPPAQLLRQRPSRALRAALRASSERTAERIEGSDARPAGIVPRP